MAESLICRGCKNPLTAEASCALCELAKKNLLVEDDGDPDSLAKDATRVLRLLKTQLKKLETFARKTETYDPSIAKEAMRMAGAYSKLLDTSRKVIQDGTDAVEAMSFQERAAIITEWFIGLPPAYRRQLFASWSRHVDTEQPLPAPEPILQRIH